MSRRWFALVTAVVLVSAAGLWGCGEEETKIVTPEPAIKVAVAATPTTLTTGEKVTVAAAVETTLPGPFSYAWKANGGTFVDAADDSTTWIAPDDNGVYTLSAVVTDGHDVGIGMADVQVGEYVPTDSPYYRGASYCATCHDGGVGGDQYASWSQSRHEQALRALAGIGMDRNPICLPCHTVGSVGMNANPALKNGGYDETAVERLAGVQCENCHGPGSSHPTTEATLPKTIAAGLCKDCHQGEHHPTGAEWDASLHSQVVQEAALRASCAKCHNGLVSGEYLDDPEAFQNPSSNPTSSAPVTCVVCHDPHGNDNPGYLRNASVDDFLALPNGHLVEEAGAGRLCISCHNGRRTNANVQDQIENGSAHFGPHHSVQGDMLKGVNAYQGVADENFPWSTSRHILVEDACITCHTHPHQVGSEGQMFTGHDFNPTVQACEPCHGVLNDFSDVLAKADYDGDGVIEGVQPEIEGLLGNLEQTIIEASASPEQRAILEAAFEDSLGSPRVTTVAQREAGYNWSYISFDASEGVHNTTYAVQLLQQSILHLNPRGLAGAHIVRGEE